jgi:hypothetical protein
MTQRRPLANDENPTEQTRENVPHGVEPGWRPGGDAQRARAPEGLPDALERERASSRPRSAGGRPRTSAAARRSRPRSTAITRASSLDELLGRGELRRLGEPRRAVLARAVERRWPAGEQWDLEERELNTVVHVGAEIAMPLALEPWRRLLHAHLRAPYWFGVGTTASGGG